MLDPMHVISNGMGAPSMRLLVMAAEGEIDANLSITGDTGWELDRTWSNGAVTTAREYFSTVIEPYAHEHGIEAIMVRAKDRDGKELPSILDVLRGGNTTAGVPFFGSHGGRLAQACTGKWKVRAVRQELRRRLVTHAKIALALTVDEVHRMKPSDVDWCENWWPLIQLKRMYRATVLDDLDRRGIPYLLSSECDGCPHQDAWRWKRHSQGVIDELAAIESKLDGQFFTPQRIPLKHALATMDDSDQIAFECDEGGYCGL